ncbi:MAG: hypothetical protein RSB76_02880 [Clostridia bacterium]
MEIHKIIVAVVVAAVAVNQSHNHNHNLNVLYVKYNAHKLKIMNTDAMAKMAAAKIK